MFQTVKKKNVLKAEIKSENQAWVLGVRVRPCGDAGGPGRDSHQPCAEARPLATARGLEEFLNDSGINHIDSNVSLL